jgi:lactoylglutathione lyase/methylmalonyl-CoA/ethylmalonyl-CoA epimerase
MIKGVQRISVAVQDLGVALRFYRDALGLRVTEERELPENGLKLVRLDAGWTVIELMQPTQTEGAVADFLRRRGEGVHHVALEVDDLELELRTLLARGTELLDREPRDGPGGRIAFVHPRSTGGVMIELNEPTAVTDPARTEPSEGSRGAAGSGP